MQINTSNKFKPRHERKGESIMTNYFRITAYHPAKNICAIFDSNGRFEKLWQFSSYLVQKGFKIVEVGADDKFLDGNIPKAPAGAQLLVRACAKGSPQRDGNVVTVQGRSYEVTP